MAGQARDRAGKARVVSPAFELVAASGISISETAYNATVDKGDSCRVEWDHTGDSFPVSGL